MASIIEYARIMGSSVVVYVFVIAAIRLFGKKELSQLSVVDLVFVLLISNSVQNAMVGSNSSLSGGLAAATALFITNHALKLFLYRSPRFSRLVQGQAMMLIYEGKLNHSNMEKAQLTTDEIMEAIREHGVSSIKDVNLAVLEVDGNISVLSDDYRSRTSRKCRSRQACAGGAKSR